jgi:hypothetical protein
MRVVTLALLALLLGIGWLGLWPLSVALSHSPLFTAAFLDSHSQAQQVLQFTLRVARRLVPGLPDAPLTDPLGSPAYLVPANALAVLLTLIAAVYLAAVVLLDRGLGRAWLAPWVVLLGAVGFQATCLFLPGLFSQDVFSYIAYGRLAAVYDLNPYVWPPSVIAKDAVLPWVADIWRGYASPYGPVLVAVQAVMARLAGDIAIVDQALAYRVLANALLLVNIGLLWRLLGRLVPLDRARRTAALAALAWNPLVLFEVSANAHNDGLMVTFTLLAFLAAPGSSNGFLSIASFTVGALVKYLSGLGLVWATIASIARGTSWRNRALRLVGIVAIGLTLVLAISAPWLELPDSLGPLLDETAGVGFVNSLPDDLTLAIARRIGASVDPARSFERLLVIAAFVVYLAWEARRVWETATGAAVARALVRSCLIYILAVSTSTQPWYFCLPVSVAVALGWRWRMTQVTVAYSVLALPALYLSYYLRDSMPGWINVVYGLAPLALFALDLAAWARARAHVPPAEAVSDDEQRAGRHRVARAIVEKAGR